MTIVLVITVDATPVVPLQELHTGAEIAGVRLADAIDGFKSLCVRGVAPPLASVGSHGTVIVIVTVGVATSGGMLLTTTVSAFDTPTFTLVESHSPLRPALSVALAVI